jgi:hypothetical protein
VLGGTTLELVDGGVVCPFSPLGVDIMALDVLGGGSVAMKTPSKVLGSVFVGQPMGSLW